MSKHKLRQAHGAIIGNETVSGHDPLRYIDSDYKPLIIISLVLLVVALISGYYQPLAKINNLNESIAETSYFFDTRAELTEELNAKTRAKIESNKIYIDYEQFITLRTATEKENEQAAAAYEKALQQYNAGDKSGDKPKLTLLPLPTFEEIDKGQQLDGIIKRLESLDNEIDILRLNKPNDSLIKDRITAALEFAELSKDIVTNRNLDQYNLGLTDEQEEKQVELLERFSGLIDPQDHVKGGELDWLITRSKETIRAAQANQDDLTDSEKRGLELLEEFNIDSIPRRKHEILGYINDTWGTQYRDVLIKWKNARELELAFTNYERQLTAEAKREQVQKDLLLKQQIDQAKRNAEYEASRARSKAKQAELKAQRDAEQAIIDQQRKAEQAQANARAEQARREAQAQIDKYKSEASTLINDKKMRFGGKSFLNTVSAKPYAKVSFANSQLIGVKVFGNKNQKDSNKRKALREVCGGGKAEVIQDSQTSTQYKMVVLCK